MANELVQEYISHILNDFVERTTIDNRLRSILAAYERAKDDPNTKIPSYFMAALEAARQAQ